MPNRFRRRIKMRPDGTLNINLSEPERDLLNQLAATLTSELESPADPNLRRLFPPGYTEDPVREAGYQMMTGDELRQRHLDAVRNLCVTSHATNLDAAEAAAWLQSINAIRLVLGTRLGITDDSEPVHITRDDPNLSTWVAYDFLSRLLNDLVEVLSF